MASARPNFFLVGAPRAGTTAMHRYLHAHPEIFMSSVKEPHFFGSDLVLRGPRYVPYRTDEAEYLRLFEEAAGHRVIGEASPGYLISENAPREIRSFSPDAKILVIVRSPAEVVVSLHRQSLSVGDEDLPLEEAWQAQGDRRAGKRVPPACQAVHALFYRENVRFSDHLRRYFDEFGRDRVHVVVYDDLRTDPGSAYGSILRFLGVDDAFRPEFPVVNASASVRSRRAARLGDRLAGRGWNGLAGLVARTNTRRVPGTEVSAELRRSIHAELAAVVDDLGALLGRDLSAWNRPTDG